MRLSLDHKSDRNGEHGEHGGHGEQAERAAKFEKAQPDLKLLRAVLNKAALTSDGSTADAPLLCYGFGDEQQSLQQLQSDLLSALETRISRTAQPASAALLAGDNVTSLANSLAQSFARVSCHAQETDPVSKESVDYSSTAFADIDTSNARYECVVLEATIPYLDQLSMLQKARSLLSVDGHLFLLGEYLASDTDYEYSALANVDSLRNLAQRLGFELIEELDYSAGALLTLSKVIAQLAEILSGDALGFDESELKVLHRSLTEIQSEFTRGRRCFCLFEFRYRPREEDEWTSAEFSAIDSFLPAEISELFSKSFQVDFDQQLWEWKYPHGRGQCVIARTEAGGEIVAHYGGAPRDILYFGRASLAIQVCDVMVMPEVRRTYGRSSLFFRTAATFLEREIGYSVKHLLGFGFPNQKAMNIALRLGLYEKTDDFIELEFDDGGGDGYGGGNSSDIDSSWRLEELSFSEQREALDGLWANMSSSFDEGIIGLRNSEYFEYRFLQHPFYARKYYCCLQLVDGQDKLRAVAVLKLVGTEYLLMDLIVSLDDMAQAILQLLSWVRSQDSASGLKFWLTRGWYERLSFPAATVNELGIEIPCNSWNAGPPREKLTGRWWLTAGDMDFM